MSKPRITFAELRRLLLDMGFSEAITPGSHTFFAHRLPGAEVALPLYRSDRFVRPHHLITVGMMLDAAGLMNRDDFEEYVASASANQSAS